MHSVFGMYSLSGFRLITNQKKDISDMHRPYYVVKIDVIDWGEKNVCVLYLRAPLRYGKLLR